MLICYAIARYAYPLWIWSGTTLHINHTSARVFVTSQHARAAESEETTDCQDIKGDPFWCPLYDNDQW